MAALGAGAAGIGAIATTLKVGYDEWTNQTEVAAKTAAALKATGGVANVTAKDIQSLATQIEHKTGIDDEAVKTNENLLLAFKNVRNEAGKGNDIFSRATQAITDMAVATGKSSDALTTKLGKALNDPAAGLARLSQLGISFTAAQKDQIKALEESGHALEAQNMILDAVEGRYKGAAEAVGKTLPGQLAIAHQAFNDFAGMLVEKMVPAVESAIGWLKDHWPEINAAISGAWSAVKPILAAWRDLFTAVVDAVRNHWPQIAPIVDAVKTAIQTAMKVAGGALKIVADLLSGDWSKAWRDAKQVVVDVVGGIKKILGDAAGVVGSLALAVGRAAFNGIKNGVEDIVGWIGGLMGRIGSAISGAAGSVAHSAAEFAGGILHGMENGLASLGDLLARLIKAPINAIIGAIDSIAIPAFSLSIDTHIPGVGKVGIDYGGSGALFHIPQLDTGGAILETGLAVVHKGEHVIPAGMGGGGVIENHTHVYLDGKQISETVRTQLIRTSARNGRNALGFT